MAFISFVLFGIEETGSELENPFSRDPNDLPLDEICKTVLQNIEELIASESINCSLLTSNSCKNL